jgi:pyruvate dehydrogenase E2 component (dihydrolipoamide acetyltransferase)
MAEVTLPQLGETVTEGTITQWFKAVGDAVAADEPLFEVSTDKVDTEVPSPVSGTLTEIKVQEGETVEVGAVIAVVGDGDAAPAAEDAPAAEEEAPTAEEAPAADEKAPAADEKPAEGAPAEAEATPTPAADDAKPATEAPAAEARPRRDGATTGPIAGSDNRLLSPVVRRLVNENNLDPSQIAGTGPGGRITREDVLDHLDKSGGGAATTGEQAPSAPSAPAPQAPAAPAAQAPPAPAVTQPAAPTVSAGERDTVVPLSKIRKITGSHMVMSKGVSPHAWSVVEVDYANVDRTRAAIKAEFKQSEGFSLTYLPFISRATLDALREFPHLNASVSENELVVHNYVDLAIAVDLDYEGLLAPVVRDAETKRLRAIAGEIWDKAERAKSRKLGPDEISGGTFTISNNGSAGSVLTMPIINQPQVAILSTDAIVHKPVAMMGDDGHHAIAVHPVGNLAMGWDHRAFDGAYAANFLRRVKEILETKDWSTEL